MDLKIYPVPPPAMDREPSLTRPIQPGLNIEQCLEHCSALRLGSNSASLSGAGILFQCLSSLSSLSASWQSCFPLHSDLCGAVNLFALQLKLSLSVTFIAQFKTFICNRIQMSSHV